ncbi:MAG: hypothetical protein KGJ42_00755 [Acidobacteriota bacterium]|nr:hypothetical protein [Acidobacteriota bacterium]
MATSQRSRNRRSSSSRDRAPRHVEPVLDPTWQNPYAPAAHERHTHAAAVRRFALKRRLPQTIVVGVVALALVALVAMAWWLALLGLLVAALYAYDLRRVVMAYDRRGHTLAARMRDEFKVATNDTHRQRLATVLDRLAATFGVDDVTPLIVVDEGYNAALVPDASGYVLFVTSAVMEDFELIELEGVVAHCLARQRLGLLARESVASVVSMSNESRRALAGDGATFRADEVAAATIRYPLGLAGALRRCARQVLPAGSFFTSPTYDQWRWIFFDVASDASASDLSSLDDVELRARALEEW